VIPTQLSQHFRPDLRTRGDQYVAAGRVREASRGPTFYLATVAGTSDYIVELDVEPGVVRAGCSCPYAAEHGVCKHLWGALRSADAVGVLPSLLRVAGHRYDFVVRVELPPQTPRRAPASRKRDARAPNASRANRTSNPSKPSANGPPQPAWLSLLTRARQAMHYEPQPLIEPKRVEWPSDRRIVYLIDVEAGAHTRGFVVELATQRRRHDRDDVQDRGDVHDHDDDQHAEWLPPVRFGYSAEVWHSVPDPRDRQIAQLLLGARPTEPYGPNARATSYVLQSSAFDITLRAICETGRCFVRRDAVSELIGPARWDDGPAWTVQLRVEESPAARSEGLSMGHSSTQGTLRAVLRRPDDEMPLSEPLFVHADGLLFARGALARLDHGAAFAIVRELRQTPTLPLAAGELPALLEAVYALPHRLSVSLPPGAQVAERREAPQPCLDILPEPAVWQMRKHRLALSFRYGGRRVQGGEAGEEVFDRTSLSLYHRDRVAESAALQQLQLLGAKREYSYSTHAKELQVSERSLARLVPPLVALGWRVEAAGVPYRTAGAGYASVRSGVDWFELRAGVRFGNLDASLQEMLDAHRRGEDHVVLADGSKGLLPLDWLARLAPLTAGGTPVDGVLRYTPTQTSLLDALLAALPDADVDATFERARRKLRGFAQVAPADAPRSFRGTLREYQREGLGWMHFLRDFGLGGCLADDMGLGKTVQVLALLDGRRGSASRPRAPSLVVVPRSLVCNWIREAEHFAPRLRVLDHSGTDRTLGAIDAGDVDLVITTYGTLRRDAAALSQRRFDYVILDEAQNIKNAQSVSAKAARLLRSDHRLAMSGTPIENRLEELWSLLEFLNPGMLGSAAAFATLARLSGSDEAAPTARDALARAVRPVILRRTKVQVAKDLPERAEQTLSVALDGPQRKFYDGLLATYRHSLLDRVARVGVAKSRMHILEALLRLRQAACHPALVDASKSTLASAKLDALLPALEEVVAEGHKALVFSQFTGFLALLRERLDAAGLRYEYLDGRVKDRQARADRFQRDADCPLFLISLKAGGHGLNLTAAEYVFILDPWWNPAVEAQAIDRAHRIGQTRKVLATRIVAARTIEEKILELQASKRDLADAILGQDQGVLAGIGRAELELLLG